MTQFSMNYKEELLSLHAEVKLIINQADTIFTKNTIDNKELKYLVLKVLPEVVVFFEKPYMTPNLTYNESHFLEFT